MRIRATISNKNRKVYGFQPPNSERAVLQWCEAMRKPSSRVASASVSWFFAAFGLCGARPRRLWRFQLRWLRWLWLRMLRLRVPEWLRPRWPRLLKSWLRVACKAGHAVSRAFPFSSPFITWLLRCSVHEKKSQKNRAARTGPETSVLIEKKCVTTVISLCAKTDRLRYFRLTGAKIIIIRVTKMPSDLKQNQLMVIATRAAVRLKRARTRISARSDPHRLCRVEKGRFQKRAEEFW